MVALRINRRGSIARRRIILIIWRFPTMITAGDFRNGMTFEEDGNVMQIIEFLHVMPGKGAAFV